ncbi:MAG: hypothetical protein J2P26_12055, partial [Nocardiopsaceae bacterium]|nr:hypothetical protein [Nocardiopsaceae bacterium]
APGYMTAKTLAQVRWTARDGQVRTGEELVPAGARAGMTVRVWLDGTGQLSEAPLTDTQVADQAYLTGMAVVLLFAVATAAAGILSHRALDRRRMAAWEAEWRGAGPRWTTRA